MTLEFRVKSPVKVKLKTTLGKSKSTSEISGRRSTGQGNMDDYAKPTQRIISNPLARKRSLQQIQAQEEAFDDSRWGDTDNEDGGAASADDRPGYQRDEVDPIVLSGDEAQPAVKKRKSVGSTGRKESIGDGAPASIGKGKGKAKEVPDRTGNGTPVEKCLTALKDVIQKVSPTLAMWLLWSSSGI